MQRGRERSEKGRQSEKEGETTESVRPCALHPRAVSGLLAFVASPGRGRAGSGVGVTVDSRSAGGGMETGIASERGRAVSACGFVVGGVRCGGCCRVSRRVPGRACAARSCRCDAATPQGRCSMATSIHVEPAGMRPLRVVDAGEVDGTLRLSRQGCGDTLVDRAASPRCGLSVPS